MTWRPLVLELDLTRLDPEETLAALSLLLLVLDDLAAGRLPLGFAGNRGMGAIAVRGIDLEDDGTAVPSGDDVTARTVLGGLKGRALDGGLLAHIAEDQRDRLAKAWRSWIDGAAAKQRGAV